MDMRGLEQTYAGIYAGLVIESLPGGRVIATAPRPMSLWYLRYVAPATRFTEPVRQADGHYIMTGRTICD